MRVAFLLWSAVAAASKDDDGSGSKSTIPPNCLAHCGKEWCTVLDSHMQKICGKDYLSGPDCESCVSKNKVAIKAALPASHRCTVTDEEENDFCYSQGKDAPWAPPKGVAATAKAKHDDDKLEVEGQVNSDCVSHCGKEWCTVLDSHMQKICGKDYLSGPDCESCVSKNKVAIKAALPASHRCTVTDEEENDFCYSQGKDAPWAPPNKGEHALVNHLTKELLTEEEQQIAVKIARVKEQITEESHVPNDDDKLEVEGQVNSDCVSHCGKEWCTVLDSHMQKICGKDYLSGPDCESCVSKNKVAIRAALPASHRCTVTDEEENDFCYSQGKDAPWAPPKGVAAFALSSTVAVGDVIFTPSPTLPPGTTARNFVFTPSPTALSAQSLQYQPRSSRSNGASQGARRPRLRVRHGQVPLQPLHQRGAWCDHDKDCESKLCVEWSCAPAEAKSEPVRKRRNIQQTTVLFDLRLLSPREQDVFTTRQVKTAVARAIGIASANVLVRTPERGPGFVSIPVEVNIDAPLLDSVRGNLGSEAVRMEIADRLMLSPQKLLLTGPVVDEPADRLGRASQGAGLKLAVAGAAAVGLVVSFVVSQSRKDSEYARIGQERKLRSCAELEES